MTEKRRKIVEFEWFDIVTLDDKEGVPLSEALKIEQLVLRQVGYLIAETKEYMITAGSYVHDHPGEERFRDVQRTPMVNVIKVTKLKEAEDG